MRYTEARLTEVAEALLADIDQDTVDFQPNYDGSEREPTLLPAAFPNLLANGSEGIAVGMATSIPPHNVDELCSALLYLIKHPQASDEKLVEFVTGPDFPTGGILVESPENILQAYQTGRGSFRLRARWNKEDTGRGQYQVVITEIPYQVQKSRLIEKIAELFKAKRLLLLGDIRDESAEDIRIVLEPKVRTVDADMLMESLFRTTDLEVRIQLNMNVLDKRHVPSVMSLRQVLQAFLDHRHNVLIRRSEYRLSKIDYRLEVLAGFLIVYLNLDEIIRIIRDEEDPKAVMIAKWQLTENQVEAILNMRLRSLRRLEEMEIRREHDALSAEKAKLQGLLIHEDERWMMITEEVKATKKKFGQHTALGARRTSFAEAPKAQVISIEAFVEKEPITILCSQKGWIRALKGHGADVANAKYKDGDEAKFCIQGQTTDKLLIFTSDGKFFTLGCDKLPGGKGHGEPLNLMVDTDERAQIMTVLIYQPERWLLLASNKGKGFVVKEEDVVAQTRNGKQVLNLVEGSFAHLCRPVDGDHIAVIGKNRKMLVLRRDDIPVMKRGQGVTLQKYQVGGELSDAKSFSKEDGLTWRLGANIRTELDLTPWCGKRGSAGRLPPVGFPRHNRFED
jgi:topoisomerase-4 subunit A